MFLAKDLEDKRGNFMVFLFLISFFPFLNIEGKEITIFSAKPDYTSCLLVSQPTRSSYQFYNNCGERLHISVCVTDFLGEQKLYQSGRAIPTSFRYTIYLANPFPKNVEWAAGSSPPLLTSCGNHPKR